MDSRERTIGINREALDQQLKDKAEAAYKERGEKLEQGDGLMVCFYFRSDYDSCGTHLPFILP